MTTIKKVLCPLDFSEPSYTALAMARSLAASYDAELLLLHVVPFPAPNPRGLSSETEAENFALQEAEVKLRSLASASDNVRYAMRVGDEASQIMDTAKTERADVIVMSTHGLTGWRRIVLGSVTEKVLRHSICPVLTVRCPAKIPHTESAVETSRNMVVPTHGGAAHGVPTTGMLQHEAPPATVPEKFSLKKILCPIDFSAPSSAALETAGSLAMKFDAELCVLHVMEPLDLALDIVPKEEFDESRSADAAHKIHLAVQEHLATGIRSRALVESGDPTSGILCAADKEQVDLIVIATHGLSGWRHFMFGSVAEEVIRLSRHSVLTVHRTPETPPDKPIAAS